MSLRRIWSCTSLFIGLIIGFVAVESIVAAGFLSLLHFKASNDSALKSQQVLIELERMMGTVTRAETSQRGYIITGTDDDLVPYRGALDTFEAHIRRIGTLTRHDDTQQNLVASLDTQITRRADEMDHVIVARRTEGLPFAKSVVVVNRQNGTMDRIHEIAGQIREEETRALNHHREDSNVWALTSGSFVAVFFLLTAALFTLCGIVMKLALTSQAQAERILRALPHPSPTAATKSL
ncbi:MAG: hypothetical protein OJF47_003394 [Nitrospira sp.]|jgi:CHASE3 domain sensor protein|nr:MAG: hypothetical protein OJF47_003394 [Nitrospira sp.]